MKRGKSRGFSCFFSRGHGGERGDEEEEAEKGERGLGGVVVIEKQEKQERGLQNYKNTPPSSILVRNCSIRDTASVICNTNSKLKIDKTNFH